MIIYFKNSAIDTNTHYQTYALTLSVWALNILIMIISLTCLLVNDPVIYSDSEAYKEYIQMRKKAEDNLSKVITTIIQNNNVVICNFIITNFISIVNREIEKLQFLSS